MFINREDRRVLVVAPHPDDEVLGVGGTLLRRKFEGSSIAWLIITHVSEELGWSREKVLQRNREISLVSKFFAFDKVYNLKFPPTKLDALPMADIVQKIAEVIQSYAPTELFIPHAGDVHSDHVVVHNAVISSTKSFRYPCVKRVLTYETLSETDFGLDISRQFQPNTFINISDFLDKKIVAMKMYPTEMGDFPFPRSSTSIVSLAQYRGSTSGFRAAEAFQLLRARE
jgi:N-acetylglucosamine malate deacetylase 1